MFAPYRGYIAPVVAYGHRVLYSAADWKCNEDNLTFNITCDDTVYHGTATVSTHGRKIEGKHAYNLVTDDPNTQTAAIEALALLQDHTDTTQPGKSSLAGKFLGQDGRFVDLPADQHRREMLMQSVRSTKPLHQHPVDGIRFGTMVPRIASMPHCHRDTLIMWNRRDR